MAAARLRQPHEVGEAQGGVAQAGHGAGCVAGADLGCVLVQGNVPQVVHGFHSPVLPDVLGQVGGGGLVHRQVGEGVDAFQGEPAGGQDAASADDLQDLVGVGEGQVGDGGHLDPPDLVAAVGGGAGLVHQRDLSPRQPSQLVVQGGVVGLDEGDVVRVLVLDQEAGVVVLGQHRVEGDHGVGQVERVEQGLERGDLVALGVDLSLGDDGAGAVQGSGQQVHSTSVAGARAAEGLAVHGHGPPLDRAGAGSGRGEGVCRLVLEPGADGGVQGVAVQAGQEAAQGAGPWDAADQAGLARSAGSSPAAKRAIAATVVA